VRVGIGYDIHALKKGRKLILGGVTIPYPKGLFGHSDGDALFHAIIDAVLGAMGEGDIGELFPDSDPKNKGVSSERFVRKVSEMLKKKRLRVAHIDSVVIAEAPKLGPYKAAIKKRIAAAFGLSASSVGVKAKTNEGFGPLGKNQAIACYAVVSLTK
jgi:2-C-methyl-D-erythritol 2,4-cyclodiphosphate synthase